MLTFLILCTIFGFNQVRSFPREKRQTTCTFGSLRFGSETQLLEKCGLSGYFPICNLAWNNNMNKEAIVACRMAGECTGDACLSAVGRLVQTTTPTTREDRSCTGTEDQFSQCPEVMPDPSNDCQNQHYIISCPVNGNWGDWGSWQPCSVTCGSGTETRSRECTNPPPSYGGSDCIGDATQVRECARDPCPVNGEWSDWDAWGACSVTCGSGSQSHSRTCSNPAPANGGAECSGLATETRTCDQGACPVNGEWSVWGGWGACSVTCGSGSQSRSHTCTNPAPANGGAVCSGSSTETRECDQQSCPVDGKWSEWNEWGACSVTCGLGSQSRSRTCTNPAPANDGADCSGPNIDTQTCDQGRCTIDGGWCEWSSWASCTEKSGSITMTRSRSCRCPEPRTGGLPCEGLSADIAKCTGHNCDTDSGSQWGKWGRWSKCKPSCGFGIRKRKRRCINKNGDFVNSHIHCPGLHKDVDWCLHPQCSTCGKESNVLSEDGVAVLCSNIHACPKHYQCHQDYILDGVCCRSEKGIGYRGNHGYGYKINDNEGTDSYTFTDNGTSPIHDSWKDVKRLMRKLTGKHKKSFIKTIQKLRVRKKLKKVKTSKTYHHTVITG